MERLPQQVSEKLINAISVYDIFVINMIWPQKAKYIIYFTLLQRSINCCCALRLYHWCTLTSVIRQRFPIHGTTNRIGRFGCSKKYRKDQERFEGKQIYGIYRDTYLYDVFSFPRELLFKLKRNCYCFSLGCLPANRYFTWMCCSTIRDT